MNKNLDFLIKTFLFGALIYLPIFGFLETLPIRVWDEARLAINSYEMLNNGNFIVTHFDGSPDMWNTKPPLLIWLQVMCMKTFGINELAVRFPSALAALFTCLALLVFSLKYLKKYWFGFIAVFVLITCHGYINIHATRTGDYDALLTLFTTTSGLFFFAYCENKNQRFLYLFFLTTALAVLTKSITGMLFMPAILIYSIIQKEFIPLLRNKHFYIGLSSFLVMVVGYYLLRENFNPGYIDAVSKNELGGRYLEVIENHQNHFWYYFNNFIDFQITVWHLFIPCGFIVGLAIKDKKINRLTLFSLLMIFTFFIIISTAQTKLEWYDVPMYPFLAIVIAIFIHFIFEILQHSPLINQMLRVNTMPFLLLFFIGITPLQNMIKKTYKPQEYSWDKEFYELGYYLKEAIKGKHDLNNQYLVYDGYNAHNQFYINILNNQGTNISVKACDQLKPNDLVIAQQNEVKQKIESSYDYKEIQHKGNIITYQIHGRKK